MMETFIIVDSIYERLFYCYPFPPTIHVFITIMNSIFTRFVLTSTFIFARDLHRFYYPPSHALFLYYYIFDIFFIRRYY